MSTSPSPAPAPSKRGRKRDDNLPPNRARDVQRAFRARRASHLEALEARVVILEEENARFRLMLSLPPSERSPLGTGPTGRGKLTCYLSPSPGAVEELPNVGSPTSPETPTYAIQNSHNHHHSQPPALPHRPTSAMEALLLGGGSNLNGGADPSSQTSSNTAASAASLVEHRFGSQSPPVPTNSSNGNSSAYLNTTSGKQSNSWSAGNHQHQHPQFVWQSTQSQNQSQYTGGLQPEQHQQQPPPRLYPAHLLHQQAQAQG